MAMRSLGYMPNEVELEVIIQRLDIDGMFLSLFLPLSLSLSHSLSLSLWVSKFKSAQAVAYNPIPALYAYMFVLLSVSPGDGQVGFEEFVTLLGPKLSSAGMPDKFHGADFDSVFWKVCVVINIISQV